MLLVADGQSYQSSVLDIFDPCIANSTQLELNLSFSVLYSYLHSLVNLLRILHWYTTVLLPWLIYLDLS